MRISHRAQQVIAITLGIVLVGVIIATVVREYGPSDSNIADKGNGSSVVDDTTSNKDNKDNKDDKVTPPTQDNKKEDTVAPPKNFEFTAQPGASYTALARMAVRQYAELNNINVTASQVEQAAAKLAYNAGSPYLEIGQVITINNSDVSAIVGAKVATTPPKDDTTTQPPAMDKENKPVAKSYTFVAVAGDAYCLLARSAISDYAASNNLELSGAQRIAAETFIISDAGFPRLAIGQQVTFTQDTIKKAVDKAMSLSSAELANWQPYANLAGL